MRAALESLLRARKLDVTLTPVGDASGPPRLAPDRLAPSGDAALDAALHGGLRRGQLSEITGAPSSGRTTMMTRMLAAATARGEAVAVVDAADTFDPISAAARGVALAQLLWVREAGGAPRGSNDPASRALKAFSLILQAGGFGLVVLDLADVPPIALRRFPFTTWMRVARIVEGSDTVALLVGADRIARSAGGATIVLETSALEASPARWRGDAARARLFDGVHPSPRIVRGR